jgi:hypothetical protein
MNNGIRIVLFEVALKGPIVGKTEREQCTGCSDGTKWDNISTVIGTSNTRELLTRHRMKVGELNRIANPGFHSCV